MARVQLSATGFYATPKIHWDRDKRQRAGRSTTSPMARPCSEVAVDTLTGEYTVVRVDILHDVGRSLNPAIDIGQIEGGFIQGMGWLTTEELWWDEQGPAAHARALHLQDPGLPPTGRAMFNVAPGRMAGEPRGRRSTAPRRSASRR